MSINIFFLYNSTETYTNAVFEHLDAFQKYSAGKVFFCHQNQYTKFNVNLAKFDVVFIHFSVRLPYDQVAVSTIEALCGYPGLKVLFIQDEYDHTKRAWYWIKKLGINLVFTVVPPEGITRVYPPEEFSGVRFVSNLTGYVPETLPVDIDLYPPSKRHLIVGYRGRPLPLRYGKLGQEKVEIGRMVKQYCQFHGIQHDIEWTEGARIYGPRWYEFMGSCRAMLGSESGSNVFDWDGNLADRIETFKKNSRSATEEDIYRKFIDPLEIPGLMNQVSPRVFEAIAFKTVLVLFEGNYSRVVEPWKHFIPLKKDGSNLSDVFNLLQDNKFVDDMVERAYNDVITSGKYSYQTFIKMVDAEIQSALSTVCDVTNSPLSLKNPPNNYLETSNITTYPIRAEHLGQNIRNISLRQMAYQAWGLLPQSTRNYLKPVLKIIFKKIFT